MRTRSLALVVAGACLAVAAAGCGGDESDTSSAESATVTEIERICDDWRSALDRRGPFPVEDFDPENPSPQDLPAVGEYFGAGHAAMDQAIAELHQISPPDDIAADTEALIAALEQELESGRAQAAAAEAGDVAAFTATLDDAASSQEDVEEAGDELGTASCSF